MTQVQEQGCGESQYEGAANVHLDLRQRGLQVQELREPSRTLSSLRFHTLLLRSWLDECLKYKK